MSTAADITSTGYYGSEDEASYAKHAHLLGSVYDVGGPNDWKPTALPGGTRQIQFAEGRLEGHGVGDLIDEPYVTDAATAVPTPGTRWDYYFAHRAWNGDETSGTSVERVAGTSTFAPDSVSRDTSPGTATGDDQPLAAVQWGYGLTAPVQIVSLLRAASKSITLLQPEAPLPTDVPLGTLVWRPVRATPADPTSPIVGENCWRRTYVGGTLSYQLVVPWRTEWDASRGGDDTFGGGTWGSFTGLTVPDAPPGRLRVEGVARAQLVSNVSDAGTVRLLANSGGPLLDVNRISEARLDLISTVTAHPISGGYLHPGGPLNVMLQVRTNNFNAWAVFGSGLVVNWRGSA